MAPRRIGSSAAIGALVALACACTGNIGDHTGAPPTPPEEDLATRCAGAADDVGVAPLRRLTKLEYANTVTALLGIDTSVLPAEFEADTPNGGFFANNGELVSERQLGAYLDAAEAFADAAADTDGGLGALPGVDLDCDFAETACVRDFVRIFGKRAFRRPLTDDEIDRYADAFEAARETWDADTAARLVVQAFLQSPSFLYLPEIGAGDALAPGEVTPLDPYELASRLSYFLWRTMPDDALLEAADDGRLASDEGVTAEVERMLRDERARPSIESFHAQWLHLTDLASVYKEAPDWNPDVAAALQRETLATASDTFLDATSDGSLSTLLTTRRSRIEPILETFYGVTAGDDGVVELPADERAGILTHASVMAATSHTDKTSWTLRGELVREDFMCQSMAAPPDVDLTKVNDPDRLTDVYCSACHTKLDPIGAAFDTYDATGRFRDDPPPLPEGPLTPFRVEPNGDDADVAGEFATPGELAARLAASRTVADCVATKWFTYAASRPPQAEDECAVYHVQEAFAASGKNLRALVVDLATSPSFRLRRAPSEEN